MDVMQVAQRLSLTAFLGCIQFMHQC